MQDIIIGKLKKLDYASEEEYKSLRTNLQFCGKEVKVIGITSCIPNEGKSSVAINIARSIAETGKKVLLVDCDMRKSVLVGRHRITKASNGLSHFLSGYRELDESLCQTNIPNLYMILAGPIPPNPSELLVSSKMRRLVKELREVCDVIILDAPPSLVVTDANILARIADSTIIVVAQNETKYDSLEKVKKSIEKVGGKIAGVVLNKVPVDPKKYENSYYYGSTTPLSASRKSNMSRKEVTQMEIERKSRENKDRMINILDSDKRTPTRVNDVDNDILSQMNEYLEQEKRRLKSDGE